MAVDTWRWAGVPFRLRAGKALGGPRKEIVITFRQPRWIPRGLEVALDEYVAGSDGPAGWSAA